MDAKKRKAIEAAGWKVGDAADFLEMSTEERKSWKAMAIGATGCEMCNSIGHIEETHLNQDGKISTERTKCSKYNT